MLGGLAVLQWIVVLTVAATTPHNGWLFYHGGDSTWYYTTAWFLARGDLPFAGIGYAWSLVVSPLAALAGPNLLEGLPPILVFQIALLLPLALVAVYAIASGIGGRAIGLVAAATWAVTPLVAPLLFDEAYRDRFTELFLPQAVGLGLLGDLPSAVCLLGATVFAFRALDLRSLPDVALSGLLTGFALGIKPANVLFLAAPATAFLLARYWRALPAFGLALAPGALALAVWKLRGLGELPVLANGGEIRLAASAVEPAAPAEDGLSQYIRLDRHRLGENYRDLRDIFWSVLLLMWVPLAGVVAVARHSIAKAGFLGAWLAVFLVFKGAAPQASIETTSFFRLLMPAFPAFALLGASLPLLLPSAGDDLRRGLRPERPLRWRGRGVVAATALLAVLPLVVVAVAPPLRDATAARSLEEKLYVPAGAFALGATSSSGRVVLRWKHPGAGASDAFFRVLRGRAQNDLDCRPRPRGRQDCLVAATPLGTTRATTFADEPPPGRWTYRVALAANWKDDPRLGDMLLLSDPATATMP